MFRSIATVSDFFAHHPLTRDSRLEAWTRFVSWQIRSRIQEEVLVPWIGGQRLAVRRGMTGATGNVYAGLHEFTNMMLHLHFLRPGDLFLDVGANVGTYTVLASGVCRAHTWAFEPAPETARHLRRNIEINQLAPLTQVFECALGRADGKVPFSEGLDTINRIVDEGTPGARLVPQRRLDDLVGQKHPAMMKVDVEGHEEAVIDGCDAVLADNSLKIVTLETVSPVVHSLLAEHGFSVSYYDPFSRKLSDAPTGYSGDTIFIRDRSAVSERLASAKTVRVFGREI